MEKARRLAVAATGGLTPNSYENPSVRSSRHMLPTIRTRSTPHTAADQTGRAGVPSACVSPEVGAPRPRPLDADGGTPTAGDAR